MKITLQNVLKNFTKNVARFNWSLYVYFAVFYLVLNLDLMGIMHFLNPSLQNIIAFISGYSIDISACLVVFLALYELIASGKGIFIHEN